jgi:hypothetical protein
VTERALKDGRLALSVYRTCGDALRVTADPEAAREVAALFLAGHRAHGCQPATARQAAAARRRREAEEG